MVCGRISIGGTSDNTKHKIGRKIKRVRHGGKRKHKHGMQSCNVYYVNINGFKSKVGSLQKILDEKNVGILLLAETKVCSKQSIKFMAHSRGLSLASTRPSLHHAVRAVITINYMAQDHFSISYY